ncbi:MAG: hypothetical protein U0930_16865 [Pirellulales bacterium]
MSPDLFNLPFVKLIIPTVLATLVIVSLLALWVMSTRRHRSDRYQRGWFSRIAYIAFIVCVAVLSITAFGSIVREGHMQHYALIAHTSGAGAFVFLLIAVSATYLPRGSATRDNWTVEQWSAWILVLVSLCTVATMLISMVPVLDTQGMNQALVVHRFAGLATAMVAIVHLFSLVAGRLGYR